MSIRVKCTHCGQLLTVKSEHMGRQVLLYIAVPAKAKEHGNKILAVDPTTGAMKWSVQAGSDPGMLALSDDGKALWVGLRGANAIQRIDLVARTAGPLMDLGRTRSGPAYPEQIVVLPGTTDSVAVSLMNKGISPRHAGVAVAPAILVGYNNETTEFGLRLLFVDPDGVTEQRPILNRVIEGFNVDIVYGGGNIYGTSGHVVDARTGHLQGTIPAKGPIAVNARANRAYVLQKDRGVVESFNTETYALVRSAKLDPGADPRGLIHLGGGGVAYFTQRQVHIVPAAELE